MVFNKDKDQQEFLTKVTKLSPEEFLGLAKLLEVKLTYANVETNEMGVRDAEEVLQDCVAAFRKLKHSHRKMILKAMEVHHGPTSGHQA